MAAHLWPRRPSAPLPRFFPNLLPLPLLAASRLRSNHGGQPAAPFHASARRARDHHFDTLGFVERLRSEGFTEEQAAALMKILNDVMEER